MGIGAVLSGHYSGQRNIMQLSLVVRSCGGIQAISCGLHTSSLLLKLDIRVHLNSSWSDMSSRVLSPEQHS